MYSFGRDFDEGLAIDNIFREYIEQKNNKGFLDRAEALSGDNLDVQKRVFEAVSYAICRGRGKRYRSRRLFGYG